MRVSRAIVRADLLGRLRSRAFLATLTLVAVLGTLFVPPLDAPYAVLRVMEHRAVYNSAWVGAAMALVATTVLSLLGFFLVRGSVEYDRSTRVSHLLAASPITGGGYLLGKAAGNFAYLALMVASLVPAATVVQLTRGEVLGLSLPDLVLPMVFLALPVMAMVAALAVVFDLVPGLRGGFGNLAYLVLWIIALSRSGSGGDLLGLSVLTTSIADAHEAAFGVRGTLSVFTDLPAGPAGTFIWTGPEWTVALAAGRLLVLAVAVLITFLGVVVFDRFERSGVGSGARGGRTTQSHRARARGDSAEAETGGPRPTGADARSTQTVALPAVAHRGQDGVPRIGRLVQAELKVMLKGRSWAWYLGAVAIAVGTVVAPLDIALRALLPAALVWPLAVWSPLGARQRWLGTADLVIGATGNHTRPLLAVFLAGVLVALMATAGAVVRLTASGLWAELVALVVGVLLVPALAVVLGTVTGTPRAFEAVYVLLWYLGPVNRAGLFDFTAAPMAAGLATVLLLSLAWIVRTREGLAS